MLKKLKNKKVIIVSIMIMLTCCLMLSYASFVVTSSNYKASELLVSELSYSLTIYDENNNQIDNPIRVSANTTKIYNIVVRSINKIDSKYTLAYNSQDNLTVKYSNRTSWSTEDYIKDYNSNNTKNVRIVVENKSNEERQVSIKIFGGYRYNDYIKIDTKGYTRITEEYDEELLASSELLNEIIKEETKCESEPCLYGGGSRSNYLNYSNNLYRIIGTYTIGTDKVTKIISENITPSTNIKEDLTNIYNSLEDKEEIIYKTNKFNCSELNCNETEYNNIGLLTKYEYELVGGENSYLNSSEGYYVLNGINIETQNGSETGGIKPVIYLPSRTRVTGSGTINDPYKILTSDINIIAYTYNGQETDIPYETLKTTKTVGSITCEKGSIPNWNYETKSLELSNIKSPEYCTIHFVDGYTVTLNVEGGIVEGSNIVHLTEGTTTTTFTVSPKGANPDESNYIKCTGGASVSLNGTIVTVNNITQDTVCTISYRYTITINSLACPATTNDNSEACWIISHGVGTNYQTKDWNGTTIYGGKTYTGCTISSYTTKYGSISSGCTGGGTFNVAPLDWYSSDSYWRYHDGVSSRYYASCSAVLNCTI